jgi:AraC family cel operon transcriptional repressor
MNSIRQIPVPDPLAQGVVWAMPNRLRYSPGDAYGLHRHAFPELFWIEEGQAHQHINGTEQILSAGDLVILRPDDAHALACPTKASAGFTMVNVPLRPELVADLSARHRAHVAHWPWDDSELPFRTALTAGQLSRLREWADELAADSSQLAVEAFLLDVLRLVCADQRHPFRAKSLPSWLAEAVRRFPEEEHLAGGTPGFIALTGRGTDHVNRLVRARLGCTTTDLVNELRLTAAARRLRMGEQPIIEIALSCGYGSLAHFYRAFAHQYRTTPRKYRQQHQALARSGQW